jgi:DNA-binding transcriptional MerR regulator
MEKTLPALPAKRYFTIGEVSELCGVKPYVLRYWEQEFTQLKPMKRRGNRRYYQHHEVLLIRRIRGLLYDEGFTISGARNRLSDVVLPWVAADDEGDEATVFDGRANGVAPAQGLAAARATGPAMAALATQAPKTALARSAECRPESWHPESLRAELESIRDLLVA